MIIYRNNKKARSLQSRYPLPVSFFHFLHVGHHRCPTVVIMSGQTTRHRRNGMDRISQSLVNEWCINGAHVSEEPPAEHLCSAASGAQLGEFRSVGPCVLLPSPELCHFRRKHNTTPRNLQPFLSNTLLDSADTTLLQESSLSHSPPCNPLLCVPLISFLRWSVLTFVSPVPLMAFLKSFKMNASQTPVGGICLHLTGTLQPTRVKQEWCTLLRNEKD